MLEGEFHEVACLARCCAVADGNGLYGMAAQHVCQALHGVGASRGGWVWEDGLVVQEAALRVEAHHLAARAESRVDAHDAVLAERRGE